LDVSFILELVAFFAAFFFGTLEFLSVADFLSAFLDFLLAFVDFFFELLALLAVVGFLASVVLGPWPQRLLFSLGS
jgi:hypothetical protein